MNSEDNAHHITRSQTIARIADCTASQQIVINDCC